MKQGRDFSRGEQFAVAQRVKELQNEWRTIRPGSGVIYMFENLLSPEREDDARIQVRFKRPRAAACRSAMSCSK